MEKFELVYKPFGEEALLIEWPSRIDEQILLDILSFQEIMEGTLGYEVVETQNTYSSLTIFYDSTRTSWQELVIELKEIRALMGKPNWNKAKVWQLPVCYDVHFGIDLELIAEKKNLTIESIRELHSANMYRVYFTGFLPGFLYLGGLSEQLVMPRKETPRLRIGSGAVAIGGSQTGIYPQESPGGWNIIGNCPITLFDVQSSPPCRIQAGDQIKFVPITMDEYKTLLIEIQSGSFDLKPLTK